MNQKGPNLVVWEITLKCNLKCFHCGSSAGKARLDELSTKEGIKLCRDLAEIGARGITLFGGEPFLRKDWHILGKEIKDLDMKLSIVSNGFVNANDIIPKLVKLEVDSIQVGLDGTTETHDHIRSIAGSFERAMEFIHLSKEENLPIGAITTVHRMNFKELSEMKDLIIKEGIGWQIQEAVPIGRFPKEMVLSKEEYYSLGLFIASIQKKYSSEGISVPHNLGFHSKFIPSFVDWKGCWAGKMVLGIQSDGSVKGCLALPDEFIEDNIREKGIKEIWNDPNSFAYNRKFKKEDLGENCKDCKYGEICRGGCSTRSYSLTGKIHNDPYCFYQIEKDLQM